MVHRQRGALSQLAEDQLLLLRRALVLQQREREDVDHPEIDLGSRMWGQKNRFPPPEKNELVLSILKNGVCRYCTFSTKTKQPRSDSANLEPPEPIFCPHIREPRD